MTVPTVTIVLPAKDEESAIAHTIRALPRATLEAMGYAMQVVVLDGASSDRTAEIAAAHGATVLPDSEPGKGSAVRHARPRLQGDFIVMADADGSYALDSIPRIVAQLAAGADVVSGHRVPQEGSMSGVHWVGNAMLSGLASVLYGRVCRDLCTGMWGFRRDVLHMMPLRSRRFGLEAEFFALSRRLDFRFVQIPVDYLPRSGYPKLRLARDGVRIVRRVIGTRFVRISPVVRSQVRSLSRVGSTPMEGGP